MSVSARRARFRELHAREQLFLMPNPWDAGSARLLASVGFEALATTSAGFAWSLGKPDQAVARDELAAHVAAVAAATPLPLNVDSERCYPDDAGGIAETVAMLADAGAAGFSIEDYDPESDRIDDVGVAAERGAEAAEAAQALAAPIARLVAYRDAGADCVYAPGLSTMEQVRAVVDALGVPVNVLALASGPSVQELAAAGVRRVSTGGALARFSYGALLEAARELLAQGTSTYSKRAPSSHALEQALDQSQALRAIL